MKVNEYRGHQLITEKDTPGLPSSVWSIKRRIIEKERLADYEQEPKFQDFIAVINPGGYLYKHVDENYGDLIHSRFNVLLQVPLKGGETFYNGELADTKEGHYIFSKSGLEEHYTNPVEEGKRISISFGFLIPVECVRKM